MGEVDRVARVKALHFPAGVSAAMPILSHPFLCRLQYLGMHIFLLCLFRERRQKATLSPVDCEGPPRLQCQDRIRPKAFRELGHACAALPRISVALTTVV